MMMMKNVSNKPLKNTRTFVLNKSPSMDLQTPPQLPLTTTSYVPKKSPLQQLELAASPQLVVGQEILHFGHPQHPLSQLNLPDRFTCSGCKEHGAGKRYTCQQCDFQLHDFCALPPSALCRNPFHYQHQLAFYSKPVKAGIVQPKCDVCIKPIKGYAYRCSPCNFQMHPCCSMLTGEMKILTHPHTLKLLPSASSSSAAEIGGTCGECKRRRSGRMYHCSVCDYHVHAVCAKDMMNGLHENGYNNKGKDKASVLGAAARLASQVVVEFIGGIMEGLGEGVGEVFVQNIARSSPTATTARSPTPNPPNNNLIHTSNAPLPLPLPLSRRSVHRN